MSDKLDCQCKLCTLTGNVNKLNANFRNLDYWTIVRTASYSLSTIVIAHLTFLRSMNKL